MPDSTPSALATWEVLCIMRHVIGFAVEWRTPIFITVGGIQKQFTATELCSLASLLGQWLPFSRRRRQLGRRFAPIRFPIPNAGHQLRDQLDDWRPPGLYLLRRQPKAFRFFRGRAPDHGFVLVRKR